MFYLKKFKELHVKKKYVTIKTKSILEKSKEKFLTIKTKSMLKK